MPSRFPSEFRSRIAASLATAFLLGIVPSGTARAQQVAGGNAGWQSYFGCWQPVAAASSASPAGAPGRAVCIAPVEGVAAIEFVTVFRDSVVDRLRVNTTGARIPASRAGCAGWESAERGRASRVYMRSDYVCEGGVQRKSSGLIAMLSPGEWIDIQAIDVAGQSSITLQRYREVAAPAVVADEMTTALKDKSLAISASRIAGGSALSLDDIVDASNNASTAAVEAWLLERRQGFVLQRKHVEYLDNKNVPESVIDVVVALSYSEVFGTELSRRRLALYPMNETPVNSLRVASPDYVAPETLGSSSSRYGMAVDRSYNDRRNYGGSVDYFYDQSYYSPFGFFFYDTPTFRNRYYRPTQPVVIIIKPPTPGSANPPVVDPPVPQLPPVRLFSGQGYTNGTRTTTGSSTTNNQSSDVTTGASSTSTPVTGRGAGAAVSGSTSGSTTGTTNSGSTTTGTTNTGRTATGRNSGASGNANTATPPANPPAATPVRTAQPRQGATTGGSGATTGSGSSSTGTSGGGATKPPPTPPPTTGRGRGGG